MKIEEFNLSKWIVITPQGDEALLLPYIKEFIEEIIEDIEGGFEGVELIERIKNKAGDKLI